jgi:hypothetical protein
VPEEFSDPSAKAFERRAEAVTLLRYDLYYKAVFLNT